MLSTGHPVPGLMMVEGEPYRPDPLQPEWTILLFLLIFALLAWVRSSYPLRLRMVLDCIGTPRFIRQVIRDESPLKHPASWTILSVFLFTGGLFLYQCSEHYSWGFLRPEGFSAFGSFLLVIAGAVLLKLLSLRLLRLLVGADLGFHDHEFHLLLILQALGISLIPLTLFIAYLDPLPLSWGFGLSFALIGWAYLLFLFRTVQIAGQKAIPPFYIFLYLCTLEILPLIVVSKAFIDNY